ncbi:MAG: hypothetical protein ACRDID_04410 [Ktedonobacterales bacterium]
MTVSANQCFLVIMLIAAVRGYMRGWHREIITCAITLGTVLFLTIGGGDAIAVALSSIPNLFRGVTPNLSLNVVPPNPTFNLVVLIGFTVLADFAGSHYGTAPKSQQHRISGLLAGTVTGLALVYYITSHLIPSTTLNLSSPTTALATSWIIALFGVGMMILLLVALVRK